MEPCSRFVFCFLVAYLKKRSDPFIRRHCMGVALLLYVIICVSLFVCRSFHLSSRWEGFFRAEFLLF